MNAIHAVVSGRVQMVMYRDFAQRKARGLGIVGTVQNLKDGTVEIFAEGTEEAIKAYIAKLHKGSILSRVDSVAVNEISATGKYTDFEIIF